MSVRAGLGPGTLGELIDIGGYRLSRKRCQRVVDELRAEFERHGAVTKGVTLDELFTEERPADEAALSSSRIPVETCVFRLGSTGTRGNPSFRMVERIRPGERGIRVPPPVPTVIASATQSPVLL